MPVQFQLSLTICPTTKGHIDTTAKLLSITPDGDSIRLVFSLPLAFHVSLIPKGYVALDGTSLTLTTLSLPATETTPLAPGYGAFGIMLVAHTQEHTILATKKVGSSVNVECDVVGKGVESVVRNALEGAADEGGALNKMIERAVERVLERRGLLAKE